MTVSNVYATVSPLNCGYLSPPGSKFCADVTDPAEKLTMPSLAFYIYHPPSKSKIVFDLSIRKDLTKYHPGLQRHIQTRHPLSSENDVSSALRLGYVEPTEINYVIMSHVHWDHVGTPSDFINAIFIAGFNTGKLLRNEMGEDLYNPYFEPDLLPKDRTIELDDVPIEGSKSKVFNKDHGWFWQQKAPIPQVIDMFNDGLIYLVDSPGHLPGHLNVLIRIEESRWIYLAADACHHARIFSGLTEFATWKDAKGKTQSIHKDWDAAHHTLDMMRSLKKEGLGGIPVDVLLAHDGEWAETHKEYFFPNHL